MCDEIRVPNRSRAAHPGPDPDETYAMTVYVSDTIDAGSDDQEVRFAPSPPATSTASRHRDGRTMRFASHRRRRPRRPPPPVPFASRPAAAAAAPRRPRRPRPVFLRLFPPPDPSEPHVRAARGRGPRRRGVGGSLRGRRAHPRARGVRGGARTRTRSRASWVACPSPWTPSARTATRRSTSRRSTATPPSFASSWRRARTPSCVTATGGRRYTTRAPAVSTTSSTRSSKPRRRADVSPRRLTRAMETGRRRCTRRPEGDTCPWSHVSSPRARRETRRRTRGSCRFTSRRKGGRRTRVRAGPSRTMTRVTT